MVVAQLAFRAWALYPSWFYADDYRLVGQARDSSLGVDYLTRPYDSQFMPVGRLLAWVVGRADHLDWHLAASMSLGLQALASVACLWMLVVVFGRRWQILLPLGVYLSSAMTMPALMWWAAALNQLPLQAVFFAAVATWTAYLRGRRFRWIALTMLVLGVGLLCYVKTLLVFVVLAYVAVAYFSSGGVLRRPWTAVRRYWPAALAGLGVGGAFLVYYVTQVPQIVATGEAPVAGALARSMLGRALVVGMLGGPWRWDDFNPPVGIADPPSAAVAASWVFVVVAAILLVLLRRRTGRAWLLLLAYAGAAYVLLLTTRAQIVGGTLGLEYRYLTDTVCVLVLCVGLATMSVPGAVESSEPRTRTRPRWLATRASGLVPTVALIVLLVVSGSISSVRYVLIWHHDNPGADFVTTASRGLAGHGTVDLADEPLPAEVMSGLTAPYDRSGLFVPLFADNVRFPEVSSRLAVLDKDGSPHDAVIRPNVVSGPGPVPGCGWQVANGSTTVPLEGGAGFEDTWLRIGYLASAADSMSVRVGDLTVDASVSRGLGNIFVRAPFGTSSVTLEAPRDGATVCVDTIEVGPPEPGDPL
ncbi:MAG: hypothetical protein JWM79_894 [Nocardioides sp.]|nr:hypothetical protein [Nocardioides sp.]